MGLMDQLYSRDFPILKMLMQNCGKGYVTSRSLAQIGDCTSRTIKEDMKRLSKLLGESDICTICSEKSKGYRISVMNEERYIRFEKMVALYHKFYGNNNQESYNRKVILFKLLLVKGVLSMDELSDLLFINKTTLYREFNEVKMILNSWGINTLSSNKGIEMSNVDEYRYRLLMVDASVDLYYGLGGFEEYNQALGVDKEEVRFYRRQVIGYLREKSYVVRDYDAHTLHLYLYFSTMRLNQGKTIRIVPTAYDSLKGAKEYDMARELFGLFTGLAVGEEELLALAALLKVSKDIDLKSVKDEGYIDRSLMEEARQMLEEALQSCQSTCMAELFGDDIFAAYENDFISIFMKLITDISYGFPGAIRMIHNTEGELDLSETAMELSRNIICFLAERYETEIYGLSYLVLPYLIDCLLLRVTVPEEKKKIALCSCCGRMIAEAEKDRLLCQDANAIESIDVFSFYEVRKEDPEKYDLVIMDRRILSEPLPVPTLYYEFSHPPASLSVMLMEKDQLRWIERFSAITRTVRDLDAVNVVQFLKTISLIQAREGKEEELFHQLKQKHQIFGYDGEVMFCFPDRALCKREVIEVYELNSFARYAFVIVIDRLGRKERALLDHFIAIWKKEEEKIKALFQDKESAYRSLL